MVSEYTKEQLMEAASIEIRQRIESDAHSGLRGSTSATLETQLEYYRLGLKREVPKDWERYAKHIDPEYDTYLRLHKKFGR